MKERAIEILKQQDYQGSSSTDAETVAIKHVMGSISPNSTLDQVAELFTRADESMGEWDAPEQDHRHTKLEWRFKGKLSSRHSGVHSIFNLLQPQMIEAGYMKSDYSDWALRVENEMNKSK